MTERIAPGRYRLASFPLLMSASVVTRLLVNTASQLFFPFLSVIAAGLRIDEIALGQLVGLRSAMVLFAPALGSLADRWGYRAAMRLELLAGIVGLLFIGASVQPWMAVLGMAVMGLGVYGFVPTLRAYLAAQLPYERRARGFGILEYSWALSGIVGLFLMGQLIALVGWRAPFYALAAALLVCWFVFSELPPTERTSSTTNFSPPVRFKPSRTLWIDQLRQSLIVDANRVSTWGAIAAGVFANFGLIHINVIYGGWLATEYGLAANHLGTVALILGCADWCGSLLVSLVTDRLGKRYSALCGLGGALVICLLLPFFNQGLGMAVGSLALLRVFSEFGIVSHMTLLSEQAPTQRGKVMTLGFTGGVLGGTISSFTGPPAYAAYGVWGLGPVATGALVITLFIIVRWVEDVTG